MHVMFHLFGRDIPAYGLMITAGALLVNLVACLIIRRTRLNLWDLLILEGYGLLGAFLGAKILFLTVSAGQIAWHRITEPACLLALIRGGFVFYGGLLGGLAVLMAAARLHGIDIRAYFEKLVFLIPAAHAFGRVGCFLAGCCYGCVYEGPLAVHYPAGGFAPAGISLFPVQLAEASLLVLLAVTGEWLCLKGRLRRPVRTYLTAYAGIRFLLEFFRADAARGKALQLSTSQWISILTVMACLVFCLAEAWGSRSKRRNTDGRTESAGAVQMSGGDL